MGRNIALSKCRRQRGVSTPLSSLRFRSLDQRAIPFRMRPVKLIVRSHEIPSAGGVAKAGLRIPDEQPTVAAVLLRREKLIPVLIGKFHDALDFWHPHALRPNLKTKNSRGFVAEKPGNIRADIFFARPRRFVEIADADGFDRSRRQRGECNRVSFGGQRLFLSGRFAMRLALASAGIPIFGRLSKAIDGSSPLTVHAERPPMSPMVNNARQSRIFVIGRLLQCQTAPLGADPRQPQGLHEPILQHSMAALDSPLGQTVSAVPHSPKLPPRSHHA